MNKELKDILLLKGLVSFKLREYEECLETYTNLETFWKTNIGEMTNELIIEAIFGKLVTLMMLNPVTAHDYLKDEILSEVFTKVPSDVKLDILIFYQVRADSTGHRDHLRSSYKRYRLQLVGQHGHQRRPAPAAARLQRLLRAFSHLSQLASRLSWHVPQQQSCPRSLLSKADRKKQRRSTVE